MIDLRSDTVTRPTPTMLEAMMSAETGDDVFEEDPTVNAFQQKIAAMFGMEAGLFTPSGVMSNQLSIKCQTRPGEEIILEEKSHVFNYETSAAALISSVQIKPVPGAKGKLTGDLIRGALRPGKDWEPKSGLIVIENTTNKGGGACYSREELLEVKETADELGLPVHLDGARIWNAITASGIDPSFFGSIADTITVSFSKGLGAPAGSMMLGRKETIKLARRYRKLLGGGMRQVGLLAAAADYAVEQHLPLLHEDHRRAKVLAKTIDQCSGLSIDLDSVETNILLFDVNRGDAETALKQIQKHGVQMVPFGPETIRATFHFQVDDEDLKKVQQVLTGLYG